MFYMKIPCMDLDQIYNSGQVYTWYKIRDGKYVIPFRDKVVKVEQRLDNFTFSCTEDEFYDIWYKYFDIETDYMNLNYRYRKIWHVPCVRGQGIRILRQDMWEMIICCMLKSRWGFEEARYIINQLREQCGKKHTNQMREIGKFRWNEFPSADDIMRKIHRLVMNEDAVEWIEKICEDVLDGWLDFGYIDILFEKELIEYLQEFDRITITTATEISLFAGHNFHSFPVDRAIRIILEKQFDSTLTEFYDWYIMEDRYDRYIGYFRQLMWYHYTYPPVKRRLRNGTSKGM